MFNWGWISRCGELFSGLSGVVSFAKEGVYRYDSWASKVSNHLFSRTGVYLPKEVLQLAQIIGFFAGVSWVYSKTLGSARAREEQLESPESYAYLPLNLLDYTSRGGPWDRNEELQYVWVLRNYQDESKVVSYHPLKSKIMWKTCFAGEGRGLSDEDLSGLEYYREYSTRENIDRVDLLTTHMMRESGVDDSLTHRGRLPKVIIELSERFCYVNHFRSLHPDTGVTLIPGIKDWHYAEIKSLLLFGGLINDPITAKLTSDLDHDTRQAIFDSVLVNCAGNEHQNESRTVGLIGYCYRTILQDQTRSLDIIDKEWEDVLRLRGSLELRKSLGDWVRDLERISKDFGLLMYLPETTREIVRKELLLYSMILNQISVFPDDQLVNNDKLIITSVFSRFSSQHLLFMDDRSATGGEGFLCLNEYPDDYLKGLRNLNDYLSHFYLRRGSQYADLPDFQVGRVVKHRIAEIEPSDIRQVVKLTGKGVRFYDLLNGHEHKDSKYLSYGPQPVSLTTESLYEITSLWGFNVNDYLRVEKSVYADYFSYNRRVEDPLAPEDPVIKRYVDRILDVLETPQDLWLRFCLKNMDIETALKVVERTDPDIGTFARAGRSFVTLYGRDRQQGPLKVPDDHSPNLLNYMITNCLCRFSWHESVMNRVLEMTVDDPLSIREKHRLEDLRLDFLEDTVRDSPMSHEMNLYHRIYASHTIRDNLVQQLIQMKIYSGIDLEETVLNRSRAVSDTVESVIFGDEDPSNRHMFYHAIQEKRALFNSNSEDVEVKKKILNMLLQQNEVIKSHNTIPFTHTNTAPSEVLDNMFTHCRMTDDPVLTSSQATSDLLCYDLPAVTKSNTDWHNHPLDAEFSYDLESNYSLDS